MISLKLLRIKAVMIKEFTQIIRDKVNISQIIAIPLMQLLLFGYAINSNPHNLPTAVVDAENSSISRRVVAAMEHSTYFHIVKAQNSDAEGDWLLKTGEVLFVVSFPPDFTRNVIKGLHPPLLLQADATDPAATSNAIAVFNNLSSSRTLKDDLQGPLARLNQSDPPFVPEVHQLYNPLNITAYVIVSGLVGVILTMTLVIQTAMMITRENERGTIETLLSTPLRPLEVMIGKLLPFVLVGYTQVLLILIIAKILFGIPIEGSVLFLLLFSLPFIVANLSVGIMFSTIAETQLQAAQSAFFFFLPSILLSGFMFPFRGMPEWAQWVGSALPLTHYIIIIRGVLLKGNGFLELWQQQIPIILFTIVVLFIGFKRYRKTLD